AVQIQLMANEEGAAASPEHAALSEHESSSSSSESAPQVTVSSEQTTITLSMRRFELRPPPASNVSTASAWTASVGVGPAVGAGLGPRAIGLGRFFGAVQYGWFELEMGAEASLASTTRQAYGGGVRHRLMLGTIAGCVWQGPFTACALGKLGRIQAQGVGVDVPMSPKGLLAEAGPRIGYALWRNQRLMVLAHLEGLYSFTAWTVHVNHVEVWSTPRFAAVAGIDLAARFQ
ncbi:MAG TPA: hypothetical protein VIV60_05835, partial [Polyangiaceae bacterium]